MPRLLFAICLLLTGAASKVWALSAHFEGSQIVLQDGATTVRAEAKAEPERNYLTVHAVSRSGQDYYVVFGISFYSRGFRQPGHCGGGLETAIRWLHVREGKVVAEKEGRYQSCLQNRVADGLLWKDQVLEWGAWGKDEGPEGDTEQVHYAWRFDLKRPELGIVEQRQPYKLELKAKAAEPKE